MTRFLLSFALIITLVPPSNAGFTKFFKPGEAAVVLGGEDVILTKETSCKKEKWGGSEEVGCRCCILKKALRKDGTFDTSGTHVESCLKDKRCTPSAIKSLEVKLEDTVEDEEDERAYKFRTSGGVMGYGALVAKVVQEGRLIAPVKTYAHSDDISGNLTPEGVKSALVGLIPESKEVIEGWMTVKPLGSGGAQTDQLFGVFQRKARNKKQTLKYIVKGLKKISESNNLVELKRDFEAYNLENPNREEGYPAIAMSLGTAYYRGNNGKRHYITVMPAAPGKSFHDISEEFIKEVYLPYQKYRAHIRQGYIEESLETEKEYQAELGKIQKTFAVLGEQLGRFHAIGMEVKNDHLTGFSHNVHGDFHSNNVFYGKVKDKDIITFIDPETLVISFRKARDVARDLRHFYLYLTLHFKDNQNVARLVEDKDFWHKAFIGPFLRAYVEGYSVASLPHKVKKKEVPGVNYWRSDALKIVERSLLSFTGSREDVGQSIGAIPFGFWGHQKKYLKPIFEDIKNSGVNWGYSAA